MHINTLATARGKTDRVIGLETKIKKLEVEAEYLMSTIASDESEGIVVPAISSRRVRIDAIMDEITDLINMI